MFPMAALPGLDGSGINILLGHRNNEVRLDFVVGVEGGGSLSTRACQPPPPGCGGGRVQRTAFPVSLAGVCT